MEDQLVYVTRGFKGRRRDDASVPLPPGQYLTDDFPVLSPTKIQLRRERGDSQPEYVILIA